MRRERGRGEREEKQKKRIFTKYLTFLSTLYALFHVTSKATFGFDILVRKLRLRNAKEFVHIKHLVNEKVEIQTPFCLTVESKIFPISLSTGNKRHPVSGRREHVREQLHVCVSPMSSWKPSTLCCDPVSHYSRLYAKIVSPCSFA